MNGAASIDEVQLFATHDAFSEATFFNSEILLCHTTVEELSTSFKANYSGNEPILVRADDTLSIDWTAPGWNGLAFDDSFEYNGVENLILEFRYYGEDGRTINAMGFYPPTPNRTLDAGLPDSPDGELLSFMNSLRICYTPISGVEDPGASRLLSLSASANPSDLPHLTAVLPVPGPAELEVFSADGRLVGRLSFGSLPGGEQDLAWSPRDLPAGVYVARLSACGEASTVKLALIR